MILTDEEIKKAISDDVANSKCSKYSVPISLHPRDRIISKATVDKLAGMCEEEVKKRIKDLFGECRPFASEGLTLRAFVDEISALLSAQVEKGKQEERERIQDIVKDYFVLSFGEFKAKYPWVNIGKLPGSEIWQALKWEG